MGTELEQGEEKNLFPMLFFSFIYYFCFRNLDLPLCDNAPKAPPSPLGVKLSSFWLQTICGCPGRQREPLLVTWSCAQGLGGEPQGLEKQKVAGTCTRACVHTCMSACACTYVHICICIYQIDLYILHKCVYIYCICILYVCTKTSCFKQAGVWIGRERDPESQRGELRRV